MGNTILIADDDAATLNLLKIYFTEAGFTVYAAGTCREAIRLTCQYLPDCFVLDYHLGDDTATPVCLGIRANKRIKDAPIIILSGDPSQAAYSYNTCQADVFIDKDKTYPEIVAVVSRQLRRQASITGSGRHSDLTIDSNSLCILKSGKPVVSLSAEQFRFFSVLFVESPHFVAEQDMLAWVFASSPASGTRDALNMLAHRLRVKLGLQLAKRIKNSKRLGWVYVQPRRRIKLAAKPSLNITKVQLNLA